MATGSQYGSANRSFAPSSNPADVININSSTSSNGNGNGNSSGNSNSKTRPACDRCRGQKLRCVWDDGALQCRRCVRAKAFCTIPRARPMGRPPRQQQQQQQQQRRRRSSNDCGGGGWERTTTTTTTTAAAEAAAMSSFSALDETAGLPMPDPMALDDGGVRSVIGNDALWSLPAAPSSPLRCDHFELLNW